MYSWTLAVGNIQEMLLFLKKRQSNWCRGDWPKAEVYATRYGDGNTMHTNLRWPRGIMGFTRAFRNLQGKFATAIATFNFQPRFNFSLFQLLQHNRYFQRSTAVPTFNRDSVFQRSAAIPTFNRDSVFQRSSAIPTFNHASVFQLSSANATFNCDWNSQPRFNFSTLKCDCNFQPRFDFSTLNCDSNFQVRGTFSTPDSDYYRSILLMVKKLLMVNKILMIFKTINVNY